jgi:hypothetical protein
VFLGHPDVINGAETSKRAFLRKKGLSDADIEYAYAQKRELDEKASIKIIE